jgi:Zn-dependent protease with chaperone function
MQLHIQYDRLKVIQALRFHFISRPEIKIMLILVNLFAILAAALFAFRMVRATPFLISSFLWFMLMLIFWFWMPRMVYRRSSTFQEDINLRFRDQDILLETSRGHANWDYRKFQYYIESPHFFHLYISDKSFFLIPKDACVSDDEVHEVRMFLKQKIGQK